MSSFTYQNEYNTGTGLFASGANNSGGVPIGTIIMWGTATAPSDYLLCDGTLYATGGAYAQLFAVIGTTFGSAAGQFAVPNFNGKFPAGTGGSSSIAQDREMETGVIGSDGTGAANTGTGKSVLNVEATPDHHHSATISVTLNDHNHGVGTLANSDTTAVNDDATLDTTGLDHRHWYKHIHQLDHTHNEGTFAVTGGSHDHAYGTISYTQNSHQHEMLLHTHDMPHTHTGAAHTHTLNHPITGGSNNYAYPFRWDNTGYSGYLGFLYGNIDAESLSGVTKRYYPGSNNPTQSTTPAAGGASSATTTGNSNTTDVAPQTATGTMSGSTATGGAVSGTISGDTGGATSTESAGGSYTGQSLYPTAPYANDSFTDDNAALLTIPDHTHIQQQHTHTISGNTADAAVTTATTSASVGAYETTGGLAITQQKYAPPFLSVTFCIRYRQT